ncbi:hypothetical protein [Amycolatopsis sp. NPDC059021]|uniref:hypothetical protein n=1 Tax=Amycolatopsis sp. NPDC059021 TaxID=3346704 RepID=UPI003671E70A
MKRTYLGILSALAVAVVVPPPAAQAAPAPDGWETIGDGMTSGASGIAVLSQGQGTIDALVVRDNKKTGENRAARVRIAGGKVAGVDAITWSGEVPVDLEAVEAVPGRAGEYIALASKGKGFHFKLEGGTARVLKTFPLPEGKSGDNYEGFALKSVSGKLFAVWADRGQDSRPATLYSAAFDLATLSFGKPASVEFRVSYPTANVRHASDVEITEDNRVLVSSASDPGDDGPFDSAVYAAGTLGADGAITLAGSPARIGDFPGHKIEALTCLSVSCDQVLYGTDDEAHGGWVRVV